MKKKLIVIFTTMTLAVASLAGCGTETAVEPEIVEVAEEEETVQEEPASIDLEDGEYTVTFKTDSNMFHINEVYEDKAVMTVVDGTAIAHLVLTSKNIVNLYLGTIDDAQKDGADIIEPVPEMVTYPDGLEEEVNAFDVQVPVLEEEFDLALLGKKGTWYDHKVIIKDVVPGTDFFNTADEASDIEESAEIGDTIEVTLEGGSGKATIESPAKIAKTEDGYILTVAWSSPNYDYMIVDGEKYLPVNTEGNSVFEIPVSDITVPLEVIADTVAMSTPHEIEYTISFN